MENIQNLLDAFISNTDKYNVEPFGSGLIHKTYVVKKESNMIYDKEQKHTKKKWKKIKEKKIDVDNEKNDNE
mgnify:CR=1 FL=1